MTEISSISGIRTMLGLHSALKPNVEQFRSMSPVGSGEEWFGGTQREHAHQKPLVVVQQGQGHGDSPVRSNYQQLTPEGAAAYMRQLDGLTPELAHEVHKQMELHGSALTPSTAHAGGHNRSSEYARDGFLRNEAI